MKTITGILVFGVLTLPAAPAAAQNRDWQRDLDRLIDSALVLAANAIDHVADERVQSTADRERAEQERQRMRDAAERQREIARRARERRDDRGTEYTEAFTRTVKIGRNGRVELDSFAGDVQITGGGGDDVRITATKRVHAPSEAAGRDALKATDIAVTERSSGVSIKAESTRGRFSIAEVDYVLAVPAGTELVLTAFAGDVDVKNVTGDTRLRTTSGDVTLTDMKPRDLEVTTISGDVRLERVDAERVDVNVTSGDIEYRGKLAKNGRYELRSHSGDIRIIPDASGFDVEAGTFNGDFSSDFALKIEGSQNTRTNLGPGAPGRGFPGLPGGPGRGNIRGTFNEGGATLSLHTFSGDIIITKK